MENEENIEINVFVNSKDYRRVLFWHSRKTIYSILLTLFVSMPIIFLLIGFGDGVGSFSIFDPADLLRIVLIILIIFFLVILAMTLYSIWKQSKELTKLAEETKFNFNETGIKSICKLCSSQMTWERFVKVCETEIDFVIFPQENMFYPIPKRFFESQLQINEFKKLIKGKLGDKAELLY